MSFLMAYPESLLDVVLFGICGSVGQLFIFFTLSKFGSLLLVTINVTRKMFSMLLSVAWFQHPLTFGQWMAVVLVFGGIGMDAHFSRQAKLKIESKKDK